MEHPKSNLFAKAYRTFKLPKNNIQFGPFFYVFMPEWGSENSGREAISHKWGQKGCIFLGPVIVSNDLSENLLFYVFVCISGISFNFTFGIRLFPPNSCLLSGMSSKGLKTGSCFSPVFSKLSVQNIACRLCGMHPLIFIKCYCTYIFFYLVLSCELFS